MRVLILISAASLAVSSYVFDRAAEAIDTFDNAVRRAVAAIVAFAKAVAGLVLPRQDLPPAFSFADGTALQPGLAFYEAPPQSQMRHESFVPHRSAARGA